jgi:hypothetical protein
MIEINENLIIKYKHSSLLKIKTPVVYLPFGIEKEYDCYYLKLQLRKTHDIKYNETLDMFLKKIEMIEEELEKYTGKKIKTQIRRHKKYDPIVITKIPFNYGKPNIIFEDKDKNPLNIFNIDKKEYIECELQIDRAFLYKDFVTYKIKNTRINLV